MHDMKNLGRLKHWGVHAPETTKTFEAFDEAAWSEGAIPKNYKALIAVALALTIQCPYCIELHEGRARDAGASEPDIAETVRATAALRAGGAITHGTHTTKAI